MVMLLLLLLLMMTHGFDSDDGDDGGGTVAVMVIFVVNVAVVPIHFIVECCLNTVYVQASSWYPILPHAWRYKPANQPEVSTAWQRESYLLVVGCAVACSAS